MHTSIQKKGSVDNIENYRAICIQSQVSKILEMAFSVRLLEYLEKNNLLITNQYGFRPSKSTNNAILDCLEFIYNALNNKDGIVGVFFDLTRAFNTINHKLLLSKMYGMGVRGVAHDWVRSYLSGRTQTVVIQGVKSHVGEDCLGVPQGSILGPLFFIIFMNDVREICGGLGHPVIYADDTNILVSDKNNETLLKKCNTVCLNFNQYCQNNGLILNASKSVHSQFHPKNTTIDQYPLIRMNGRSIAGDLVTKFLGVQIDQKLTWENHVDQVCTKLSSVCFLVRILKNTIDINILKLLYFGLVQSVLQYGLISWGSSAHMKKAFVSQKKILRCIEGVPPGTPCREFFKRYKFLTLPSLYIFQLVTYIAKNVTSFNKNKDIHSHNTRYADELNVPYSRLTVGQSSISFIGIKCYNKMKMKVSDNGFRDFKNRSYSFLLEQAFYSVEEFINS